MSTVQAQQESCHPPSRPVVARSDFAFSNRLDGYDPNSDQDWRHHAWHEFHVQIDLFVNVLGHDGPLGLSAASINEKLIAAFTGLAYNLATILANECLASARDGFAAAQQFQARKNSEMDEMCSTWRATCTRYSPILRDQNHIIEDAWSEVQMNLQGVARQSSASEWFVQWRRTDESGDEQSALRRNPAPRIIDGHDARLRKVAAIARAGKVTEESLTKELLGVSRTTWFAFKRRKFTGKGRVAPKTRRYVEERIDELRSVGEIGSN